MTDYTVTELDLSGRNLTILPDLFLYTNLQTLSFRKNQLISLDILPLTLQELYCWDNPIYTTCKELYGFELSVKTIEQYNEIKRMECCPMLK